MADITIVNGVYKPTYNWGAPSCTYFMGIINQRSQKTLAGPTGHRTPWPSSQASRKAVKADAVGLKPRLGVSERRPEFSEIWLVKNGIPRFWILKKNKHKQT